MRQRYPKGAQRGVGNGPRRTPRRMRTSHTRVSALTVHRLLLTRCIGVSGIDVSGVSNPRRTHNRSRHVKANTHANADDATCGSLPVMPIRNTSLPSSRALWGTVLSAPEPDHHDLLVTTVGRSGIRPATSEFGGRG